jgi:hypothetical protein
LVFCNGMAYSLAQRRRLLDRPRQPVARSARECFLLSQPHLIAVSSWWDGSQLVIAMTRRSRTARNLDETGLGRLALGSPDDVIMIDIQVSDSVPVDEADAERRSAWDF